VVIVVVVLCSCMRVTSVTQDVNKRDSVNDTPLSYACAFLMHTHERVLFNKFFPARFGQDNVVKFLLQAKADIEARRLLLSQRKLHTLPLMLTHAHAYAGPHAFVSGR